MNPLKHQVQPVVDSDTWTLIILAGGKSKRMGRDKSRIRINGVTLLGRVKAVAEACGHPVKTIRTDAVSNCGPLSGIYTGLMRAKTRWCLFLACDMPLVSRVTLEKIMSQTVCESGPVFTSSEFGFGFPLSLSTAQITQVKSLMDEGRRSIFHAAKLLSPGTFELPRNLRNELFNANTPEELSKLQTELNRRAS